MKIDLMIDEVLYSFLTLYLSHGIRQRLSDRLRLRDGSFIRSFSCMCKGCIYELYIGNRCNNKATFNISSITT
jgi:hypothetical protein